MFCIHCGKVIDDDSVFCPFCGKTQKQPDASLPKVPGPGSETRKESPIPDLPGSASQCERKAERPALPKESAGTAKGFESAVPKPDQGNTKKILWIAAAAIVLLLVVGGGGFWFYLQSSPKIDTNQLVSDLRTYRVLNQVDTFADIEGTSKNGILAPGQSVKVIQTYAQDEQTWAQLDDDSWVLASDLQYDYLLPEEAIAYESKESNSKYTTTVTADVYAAPTSVSKPLSDLEKGETVFVYETLEANGDVWGRIGQDQWIFLKKGDNTFASKVKEETAETKTDGSTSSSSNTASSSSSSTSSSVVPDSNSTYYPNVTAPEPTTIDGYGPGVYTLNYNMHLRRSPRYDGMDIDVIDKGSKVTVTNVISASNNSVWGELDYKGSGVWMCLKDNNYIYVH